MRHCINPNGRHLTCCNLLCDDQPVSLPVASFIGLMIYAAGPEDPLCRDCALALLGKVAQHVGELRASESAFLRKWYGIRLTIAIEESA